MSRLELILGSMFAGKTTELLRRLSIHSDVGLKVIYVNNSLDTRGEEYSTHNPLLKGRISFETIKSKSLKDISNLLIEFDVIGIDEGQFFEDLHDEVLNLVEKHLKFVIISALDGDYNRKPFLNILNLISISDDYIKLKPFCMECAKEKKLVNALFSYLDKKSNEKIIIGDKEIYKCLCRKCWK